MRNKIGIMVDSLKMPLPDGIRKASELGAEGIQLYAVQGAMAPENIDSAKRKALLDFISDHNLVVSAVCGDFGGHGLAVRQENTWKLDKLKRVLELAKELGCDIVTTHIGVIPEEKSLRYEVLEEACSQIGQFASEMQSVVAIETGPEKAAVLKGFLTEIGSKGLGVNFDPANLVMVTGDDPVQAVRTLKDFIVHTHAKDGKRIKPAAPEFIYNAFAEPEAYKVDFNEYFIETPLGSGDVNFPAYLKALNSVGYGGFLTIEREVGKDPLADISEAVGYLKAICKFHADPVQ